MKMIIAFVQPFMASDIVHALRAVPGLSGATFTDVKGFGRGRGADAPTSEMLHGTAGKVRVEVIVRDEIEAVVVRTIREAAQTGNRGDGKIYVLPVHRALRIATDEEGAGAV